MCKIVHIYNRYIWTPEASPWLWTETRSGGEIHGCRRHPQYVFILNTSCRVTSLNPVYSRVFAQPRSSLFLGWVHYGKGKYSRLQPKGSMLSGTHGVAEGMKSNPILVLKQTKGGVAVQKERCLQDPVRSVPPEEQRFKSVPSGQ